MTYPDENACGCGHCPTCIAWDLEYSLTEWARIKAEDDTAPVFNSGPAPPEVLEAYDARQIPRIEEEDWREQTRQKDEAYARDNEPRDPGAWDPISQRYGL